MPEDETKLQLRNLMLETQDFLQSVLLQHSAGTLNLRVEMKLANHILETYTDVLDIDWKEVAGKQDFRSHTVQSLKSFFMANLTWKAFKNLRLVSSKETRSAECMWLTTLTRLWPMAYGDGSL